MEKIIFEDLPSTKTPLNAENLNQIQTNVENSLNEVDDKFNYSTEEKIIGTWEGKPLYRKQLFFNTGVNPNAPLHIEHNISNIDEIFVDYSHSYFFSEEVGSYTLPLVGYAGNFTDVIYCTVNKTDVIIYANSGWGEVWKKNITIIYTKKTNQ